MEQDTQELPLFFFSVQAFQSESPWEVFDTKGKATNDVHFEMCQMPGMLEIAQNSTSNILHLSLSTSYQVPMLSNTKENAVRKAA